MWEEGKPGWAAAGSEIFLSLFPHSLPGFTLQ
jgi:hypothetical protein